MNARLLLFCFIGFVLNACTSLSKKHESDSRTKDTLNYVYKNIHRRAPNCGNRPDSSCDVVANFKYPFFFNQKVLNDKITYHLLNIFEFNEPWRPEITSLDTLAKRTIQDYKQFKDKGMRFTFNLFANVRSQDSSLIVLEFGVHYVFSNRRPDNYETTFKNWNSKAGKEITMNDIFINGYYEPLNKIGEKIFREQEKLTDTASLAKVYRFYKNKFQLNENFMLTPKGILFLYNLYEIKRYSKGQTKVFIPYSKIKSLLKPNTVLAQYIK